MSTKPTAEQEAAAARELAAAIIADSDKGDGTLMKRTGDAIVHHVAALLADLAARPIDDPAADMTDAAHPAWWRGHADGVRGAVWRIREAVDGTDTGAGVLGDADLERLRRDVLAAVEVAEAAEPYRNAETGSALCELMLSDRQSSFDELMKSFEAIESTRNMLDATLARYRGCRGRGAKGKHRSNPMDDRAKQIAALLKEHYLEITGADSAPTTLTAVAAVLAPMVEDIAALKAERKAQTETAPHDLADECQCGHYFCEHRQGQPPYSCEEYGCPCPRFRSMTTAAAPPAPVPQPGASRGAQVADGCRRCAEMVVRECGFAPAAVPQFVNTIEAALLGREFAARRAAIAEAEGAVRDSLQGSHGQIVRDFINGAAAAVARLRDAPAHEKPAG